MKHKGVRDAGLLVAGFFAVVLISIWLWQTAMQRLLTERLDDQLATEVRVLTALITALGEVDNEALERALVSHGSGRGSASHYARVFTASGKQLARSETDVWLDLFYSDPEELQALASAARTRMSVTTTRPGPLPAGHRALAVPLGPDRFLEVCIDRSEMAALINGSRNLYVTFLMLVLVIGGTVAWWALRRPLVLQASLDQVAALFAHGPNAPQRLKPKTGFPETDQLAQAFNRLFDQVQALQQGRRELTNNLALEFGPPVARLQGAAATALNEGRDEELARAVTAECEQIQGLVKDLFMLCDAECNARRWSIELIDLCELAEQAADHYEQAAAAKNIELYLDLGFDEMVLGNTGIVRQVIFEMLGNAIAHTLPGKWIRILRDQSFEMGIISISDNGHGLTREETARVFERFYRTEASRGRPGNGLGLSFCKAAIEAMGGCMYLSSSIGYGSSFSIELPLETPTIMDDEDEEDWDWE